ncbi:MAG: nicotinamidase-related amidase [Saprospiraceae bacterium]|jgi:nicotinamidase-related amidase
MIKKALCIVDYQNDLVHPKGKVAQGIKGGNSRLVEAQALAPYIQDAIDSCVAKGYVIVSIQSDYSLDNYIGHYRKQREKKLYVNTAVAGTWGHELYEIVLPSDAVTVTKYYFDGFYETSLHEELQKLDVDEVYICGVNTDVCVTHTAIGAAWRGYKTHLIEDLTETISPNKKTQAIEYLAGIVSVDILTSKDL